MRDENIELETARTDPTPSKGNSGHISVCSMHFPMFDDFLSCWRFEQRIGGRCWKKHVASWTSLPNRGIFRLLKGKAADIMGIKLNVVLTKAIHEL